MVVKTSVEAQNCFEQLLDARSNDDKTLAELEAWSQQATASPEASELTDEEVVRLVHEMR